MILGGFDYNGSLLGPAIVNGVAGCGFYGLLAVSLVLTYRISRTVAFVNGGLAIAGGLYWWYLSYESLNVTFPQPDFPGGLGLAIVFAGGGLIGGLYGAFVTGKRMSSYPRITITTFSLGLMLLFGGIVVSMFQGAEETPPSPFGDGTWVIENARFTHHTAYVIGFMIVLVLGTAYVLARTRFGYNVRAIADNVEAARLVGVPINRVATGVYAVAGGLSALSGALIAPDYGPAIFTMLFVFLRALTVSVLGGFNSVTLALAGAVLFAMSDSMIRTGLFGTISNGQREIITVGLLFIGVVIVQRVRGQSKELLEAQGL